MDYEAPLIDADAIADVDDVYAFELTRSDGDMSSDYIGATEAKRAASLGLYDAASASDGDFSLETEAEFHFLSLTGGHGTSTPDSLTPAPEKPDEPEESDYQRELREVNTALDTHWARHSALRSVVMRAAYGD